MQIFNIDSMSTSKIFQNQQFQPYLPTSPKQLHASSSPSNTPPLLHSHIPHRSKQTSHIETTENVATIRHENSILKEENKALKRELHLMKGQFMGKNGPLSKIPDTSDLRETIKKEEIKELRTRLEVVSKQCKMYQEIITKMQSKINKLTDQNKMLDQQLIETKIQAQEIRKQKPQKAQKPEKAQRKDVSKQKYSGLTERVNMLSSMYSSLQGSMQESEEEWRAWKQQWGKQKQYYLNRIKDLEGFMGIGVDTFKKRY